MILLDENCVKWLRVWPIFTAVISDMFVPNLELGGIWALAEDEESDMDDDGEIDWD